jgi:hypothetical protein
MCSWIAILLLTLCCLLALAASASAEGLWVLAEIGKQGTVTPISEHATLTDCLREQKSREETQRAYLRAANESSPQDQLPLPVLAASFRCLPDTVAPRGPKGKRPRWRPTKWPGPGLIATADQSEQSDDGRMISTGP